jgi:phosphate transport system protein
MLTEKMTEVRETLIRQANIVEKMLAFCRRGLLENSRDPLEEVVGVDEEEVNALEIRIDGLCLTILALYHPEAKDLRVTVMMSKMTADLERMADCAVNIAESALFLVGHPPLGNVAELLAMAEETARMVKDGIQSFIEEQADLAKDVCRRDSGIDRRRDRLWEELAGAMAADPHTIERALHLLRIANNLEKIADVTTNIAEETVFIASGFVIKHHLDEKA